jgi:hypothetical protein
MANMTPLLLPLLLAAAAGAPRGAGAYGIATAKDYLAAWSSNSTNDDINPCLVGTIVPPPATTNVRASARRR